MVKSYNTGKKYDIICISKTLLDSSANENYLLIPGYHLQYCNHPNNLKKGNVCLYFKENLSLRQIKTPFFPTAYLSYMCINYSKQCRLYYYYLSFTQSVSTEFDDFLVNFEKLLNQVRQLNPSFLVILGDFNAQSKSRWCDDITSHEGPKIESLTMSYGLQQLISDPAHLLLNSSFCIDLIFTNQLNLIVDSVVHPSLHPKCHHQITYCRFNLTVKQPTL